MPKTCSHLVVLLFSSLILDSLLLVSSQDQKPLALNCGSHGGPDEDGRTWDPDEKFLLPATSSKQVEAGFQDPSLLSTVPYMSARIFPNQATYQFQINSTSRYMLRLHFYPTTTYLQYDVRDVYFSVTANNITLLSNFSAALTCQALTQAFLIREYSLVGLDSDVLNITFTPSANNSRSFAFINGIELIQMPDMFDSANVVGFQDHTVDAKSLSLQLMYRLNVAGQYISPRNDSGGLFRSWYNDMPYLFGRGSGGTDVKAPPNLTIKYTDWPETSAPADVYKTCRQMGPDPEVNKQTNLTWMFQIDPGFMYLVRLHFCEFLLTRVNQKVFDIYFNNKPATVAPRAFDILQYTKVKGVAMYHDYAVFVEDKKGDATIRVDMFPSVESDPQYFDAQLNGLEIFKLTDSSKGLAGPNPEPSAMLVQAEIERKRVFETSSTQVFLTGGVIAVFGLITAIGLVACTRKRDHPSTDSNTSSWLPVYNSHTSASKSGQSNSGKLSALAQGQCWNFSLAEMKSATKHFSEANVIGVGGFGKVYKGTLDDGMKVAIKRSNPQSEQGVNEFQTEIEMLSKLRHKHLVSLIGFCDDGGEMCLVYDYMEKGTLREHLYNSQQANLSWKQRLEICIGAAKGLHYLHTGAKYTIIHRDVKTTNILLDEKLVAKVSDFGLSKTGPEMNQGHVSTVVKGSFGYLDPEYFKRQQLTEKSDVYSFGVVLFEVLCGRPALNPKLPKEQVSLADWALHCQRKDQLEDIIDPKLKGKISPECLKKFADTAEKCLAEHGINRPTMGDVLWNLEFALQLQETSQFSIHGSRSHTTVSGDSSFENELDSSGEDPTFSQLAHPKGR